MATLPTRAAVSRRCEWEGVLANVERRYDETRAPMPYALELAGIHARGAVRILPRLPTQARVARRHDWRPQHRRRGRPADRRRARRSSTASLCVARAGRASTRRSPAPSSRKCASACASSSTSDSTTSRSAARPSRCPAARPSAFGSPRRSDRGSSACSTSSTSRASACTSATTRACSPRSSSCATSATRCIVVEHDEETMRAADHVIDLGPGRREARRRRDRRGHGGRHHRATPARSPAST